VTCFRFIVAEEANHAVAMLCRVLRVARSGYYAWRGRQPEQGGAPSARARADGALTQRIHQIHTKSRGTYGSPRVHAELGDDGVHCGRKRVARLMRQAGLVGCHRRARRPRTTTPDRQAMRAPDRVERAFAPAQIGAPNTVWVADITYVPTNEGWLYLAAVLDAFSRHCSGWAMADHLRTELVLDAVEMAIARRRPTQDGGRRGLVHHSDHGCPRTGVHNAGLVRPRQNLDVPRQPFRTPQAYTITTSPSCNFSPLTSSPSPLQSQRRRPHLEAGIRPTQEPAD